MIRKNKIRPLYRHVIRAGFSSAWHAKRLWVLAAFAGVLQTGGIVDVVLFTLRNLVRQGSSPAMQPTGFWPRIVWDLSSASQALTSIRSVESAVFGTLIVLAVLAFSVIAQGALVFGLGTTVRGRPTTFRTLLTAGAKVFWPLVGLNLITWGSMEIARFLLLWPLSSILITPAIGAVSLYVLAALIYVATVVMFTAVHLFALNAMILEDASLYEAWRHAYHVFRRSWIMVLETALLLFFFGAALLLLGTALFFLAVAPVFFLGAYAVFFQHASLAWASLGMGLAVFFVVMIGVGAFTIAFQYAAWIDLYRRIGEGGVKAKLHRLAHWLVGEKV